MVGMCKACLEFGEPVILIFIFFFLIFLLLLLQHLTFFTLSHIYSLLAPCRTLYSWINLLKPHNNLMRWVLL